MVAFQKAERRQAKLKIALTGPSGAGKTFSALAIATGIGPRIAVIDTENGSASLYADRFAFDVVTIQPPYTVPKYLEAMKAADGYDVLIIDSITHAWAGEGGLLSKKEALDSRGGNSYTNWGSITKEHEAFKAALLNAKMHLIVTMRSKQDYVMEINDKGKQAPKKVGLAPIQRDGMEYEFTTVLDLAQDHNAQASKDRTGLFDGQLFKPTVGTGRELMAWLQTAKPAVVEPEAQVAHYPSDDIQDPPLPSTAAAPVLESKSAPVCSMCQGALKPHHSGQGYICVNATKAKDGHTRMKPEVFEAHMNSMAPAQAG